MLNQPITVPAGPGQDAPVLRARFETMLLVDDQVSERARVLPLVTAMLPAFAAYGRGTEFMTDGPAVAVEDLWPGDRLLCPDGDVAVVQALAQVTLSPQMMDATDFLLLRMLPERFGPGRPMRDLILGASAQVMQTGAARQTTLAEDLLDHDMVLGLTPPGPSVLYQVVCDRPAILRANGVFVPSFDPLTYASAQGVLIREWLGFFFDPQAAQAQALRRPTSAMLRRAMG